MTEEQSCSSCFYMEYVDKNKDEMICVHGNAMLENGSPEIIDCEPNNCPFYEEDEWENL